MIRWHTTPTVNQSSRWGVKPRLVIVHCTQGSTAAGAASWLRNPLSRASAHVVIDDEEGYRLVSDSRKAWHVGPANRQSLGLEIVGFVQWSRTEWLGHMPRLRESARVHAAWNRKYDIPLTRDTDRGYHPHDGMPGNDHTDPGPNFPWDVYLDLVKSAMGIQSPADRPYGGSLRLVLPHHAKSPFAGWEECEPVMRWIARNGLAANRAITFTWRGGRWDYRPSADPIEQRNAVIRVIRTVLVRYAGGWR